MFSSTTTKSTIIPKLPIFQQNHSQQIIPFRCRLSSSNLISTMIYNDNKITPTQTTTTTQHRNAHHSTPAIAIATPPTITTTPSSSSSSFPSPQQQLIKMLQSLIQQKQLQQFKSVTTKFTFNGTKLLREENLNHPRKIGISFSSSNVENFTSTTTPNTSTKNHQQEDYHQKQQTKACYLLSQEQEQLSKLLPINNSVTIATSTGQGDPFSMEELKVFDFYLDISFSPDQHTWIKIPGMCNQKHLMLASVFPTLARHHINPSLQYPFSHQPSKIHLVLDPLLELSPNRNSPEAIVAQRGGISMSIKLPRHLLGNFMNLTTTTTPFNHDSIANGLKSIIYQVVQLFNYDLQWGSPTLTQTTTTNDDNPNNKEEQTLLPPSLSSSWRERGILDDYYRITPIFYQLFTPFRVSTKLISGYEKQFRYHVAKNNTHHQQVSNSAATAAATRTTPHYFPANYYYNLARQTSLISTHNEQSILCYSHIESNSNNIPLFRVGDRIQWPKDQISVSKNIINTTNDDDDDVDIETSTSKKSSLIDSLDENPAVIRWTSRALNSNKIFMKCLYGNVAAEAGDSKMHGVQEYEHHLAGLAPSVYSSHPSSRSFNTFPLQSQIKQQQQHQQKNEFVVFTRK
jgi:hypothetical protein